MQGPMNTLLPAVCAYVVRLRPPDPADPTRLAGRLEHVDSGRRHDFDNSAALLACLQHEQRRQLAAAARTGPELDPDPAPDLDLNL